MKAVLFGVGRQGYRILELMVMEGIKPIHVFDINNRAMTMAKSNFPDDVELVPNNPLKLTEDQLMDFLKDYSLIMDALPSTESFQLLKTAVRTGVPAVSVSFLAEDFMELNEEAKKNNSILIPDCGAAPGFSHMMAGYSAMKLADTMNVVMKLGAIPKKPQAPFYHSITWSVDDLMEEYIRQAKIMKSSEIVWVDPFETIEEEVILDIPLQSFITDGLRSFTSTFPNIPDAEERTLRHHGHLGFMRVLKEAGILAKEKVRCEGRDITPYKAVARTLERQFSNLPKDDMFIMEIMVENDREKHTHLYNMPYDTNSNTFALVNSVAVTAVEAAKMLTDGSMKKSGVLPLELLADENNFNRMAEIHRQYGALVQLKIEIK